MSKIEKPTNIKPESWYEEYLEIENNYLLKHPEEQSEFPLTTIEEIKKYDVMANENWSHDNVSGFLQFEEKNNLEINNKLLLQYRKELESLKRWKVIKEIGVLDNNSWDFYILETHNKIDKCFEALEQGYLITAQLEEIYAEIDDWWGNEQSQKEKGIKIYEQFKFENYQEELYNFIKKNIGWRDKNRDFEIYKELRKGTLLSEIAERLECTVPNISMVNKKVQSQINNLKGRFFEIEFEKYLKSLHKFRNCKIIRDGAPGKPDIYIIDDIKKELYIFSLKNLELNKDSFCITKEQLKPELEFAYLKNTFEEYNKVVLYLVVFDSLTEKIHVKEIDYKNPSNINIYR